MICDIQNIMEIPQILRNLYKTSWDLKMKVVIDMASDRAKFIDQTQSMNLFIETPNIRKLSSMYFYAYRKGLKTLMYYLRSKPSYNAQQFTIEPVFEKINKRLNFDKVMKNLMSAINNNNKPVILSTQGISFLNLFVAFLFVNKILTKANQMKVATDI